MKNILFIVKQRSVIRATLTIVSVYAVNLKRPANSDKKSTKLVFSWRKIHSTAE